MKEEESMGTGQVNNTATEIVQTHEQRLDRAVRDLENKLDIPEGDVSHEDLVIIKALKKEDLPISQDLTERINRLEEKADEFEKRRGELVDSTDGVVGDWE